MTRSITRFGTFGRALLLLGLVAVLIGGVSVAAKRPSHDRQWKLGYAVLPYVEMEGDLATIRNIRSFSYNSDGSVRHAKYYDQTYSLTKLTGLWYGISHFYGFGLAHTFLSFGFENGEYLVISVEARKEIGESYHPVSGLWRNYELIYVVGDDRDIIGLRTHIRKERVYLYEIQVSIETTERVFQEMLDKINQIHSRPEFYNTITDNCTTSIMRHARKFSNWELFTNYKILLPGYSDELAYELGVLSTDVPLPELRERSRIDPGAVALDDPEFSVRIRNF